MKSLLLLVVVLLTNSLTSGQKCGIPKTKKINCILWDHLKVKSFQGEVFRFTSHCDYKVVEYATEDHVVSVQLENHLYKNTIQVSIDSLKYELKLAGLKVPLLVTGQRTFYLSKPVTVDEISISRPGRLLTANFEKIGMSIRWDHKANFIEVILNNKDDFDVSGLCSKECDNKVVNFVNSWTILDGCLAKFPTTNCHTSMYRSKRYCINLFQRTFKECEKDVSMESFVDTCTWLYCGCKSIKKESCLCNLLDAYSKTCTVQAGKHIEWRTQQLCPIKCANDEQEFLQCSPNANGNGVCGGTTEANNARTECVEGCYCPNGLLLHNGKCFTVDQCPCTDANGKVVAPGKSIPSDCNTCTCRNGQFDCTKEDCYHQAVVFGDPHYVTFDGKRYDFMGKCTYYLIKGRDFSIVGDHYVLERNKYVKNYLSRAPTYTKVIYINVGDNTITLKPHRSVDINGQQIKHFPHSVQGTTISQPTWSLVQVQLSNKIQVIWDGGNKATFRITTALKGRVRGLLGNFNFNPNDDFTLPNGTLTTNPHIFGHAWRVGNSDENCQIHVPVPHPCEINPAQKAVAQKVCRVLKNKIFKGCGQFDADITYEDCVYDCCENSHLGNKCACSAVKAQSSICASKGHPIDWVQQAPDCMEKCPEGLVYKSCHNDCESSCEYIGLNPTCQKQCVEGCGCPTGQTLNEFNKCKPIKDCKCKLYGKYYNAGFRYVENKHDLRSCTKARWESTKVSIEEAAKYLSLTELLAKCDKSKGLEFTSCKKDPVLTCSNMHNFVEVKEQQCHEGCECSDGLVWNVEEMICVAPENCPCHHSGRSYRELEERFTINEKCTCQNKQWKCVPNNSRSGQCSILGNYHIKKFDGTITSFSIDCEIILAQGTKGHNTFKIAMTSDIIKFEYTQHGKHHKIDIPRTTGLQYIGDAFHFTDFGSSKVYDIDIGAQLVWYSDGWTHIHIQPVWAKEVGGMCAKDVDEDLDYSGDYEENNCKLDTIKKTNIFEEDGTPVDSQCELVKGKSFEGCGSKIPVNSYFDMCTLGVDNLAQKGKSNEEINKFVCGAFAAYAQECTSIGTPVNWRSDKTCAPKCGSSQYTSCASTCSCDTIRHNRACNDGSCIEGCVPTICSKGQVYTNSTYSECINIDQCAQWNCEQKLKSMPSNCRCDYGEITCPTKPTPTTTTKTTHVPTTERTTTTTITTTELTPADEMSRKLLASHTTIKDILHCTPNSSKNCHEWTLVFKDLSPKDNQIIEAFRINIRDSEKDVKCLAYLKDKRRCACKFGREDCETGSTTDHIGENISRIGKIVKMIDFIQAHLACLMDLKKTPGRCSCLLGRKACPTDDTENAFIIDVVNIRVIYPDIIKAEQETVTNMLNVHYINEQLACINATRNQPCICEGGKPMCRFDVTEKYILTIQKDKDSKEQIFNKQAANSMKQLLCYANLKGKEGHTCSCQNGYEICVQHQDRQPITVEILEKHVQARIKQDQVIVQLNNDIKCTEQLGEKADDCVCDHGVTVCQKDEPILTEKEKCNNPKQCDEVRKQDFTPSQVELQSVLDNLKLLLKSQPTSNVSEKDKQMITIYREYIDEFNVDLACYAKLMNKTGYTCKNGNILPQDGEQVDWTKENNKQIDVDLAFVKYINSHVQCLSDLEKGCFCFGGQKICKGGQPTQEISYSIIQENEVNVAKQFYYLQHLHAELKCLAHVKNIPCTCRNGQPDCEVLDAGNEKKLIEINRINEKRQKSVDEFLTNTYVLLQCYTNLQTKSGLCTCNKNIEVCIDSRTIVNTYSMLDMYEHFTFDFEFIKKDFMCRLELTDKTKCACIRGEITCNTKTQQPKDMPTIMDLPTEIRSVETKIETTLTELELSPDDKNLLKTYITFITYINSEIPSITTNSEQFPTYKEFIHYIHRQLNCLGSLNNNHCSCSNVQMCGKTQQTNAVARILETYNEQISTNSHVYIESQLKCFKSMVDKSGFCTCRNGTVMCQKPTNMGRMYIHSRDELEQFYYHQLNCIPHLKSGCVCVNGGQICNEEAKEYMEVTSEEVSEFHVSVPQLEEYFKSQLKCLMTLNYKSAFESCVNGKITFPEEDVCAKSTCPPNTRTIRKCERCCPICEELYCTFEDPNRTDLRKVGESWTENSCEECTCINHPLIGVTVHCTHIRCSAPESNDIVFEKIIDKSQCCPKYKPVGCKHNGNVYDLNVDFVINKSPCETMNCWLNTDGRVYKRIERTVCNSTCSIGYEYKPKADACCGECHQNACLINGEARTVGQVWMSEDGCEMVCVKEEGIFKVVQQRKCPNIIDCYGSIVRIGCCYICIE